MRKVFQFSFLMFLLLSVSTSAFAGNLDNDEEICGDGYENVSNPYSYGACPSSTHMNTYPWAPAGCDRLCTGDDQDADGFPAWLDCNDKDKTIFPGRDTTDGCSAGQWRTCNTGGTYSACTAAAYTCHIGTGKTYTIDPATGNDSSNGFSAPWASQLPMFDNTQLGYHAPVAGDCFVFKTNGTLTEVAISGGLRRGLYFLNKNGTSSAPIKVRNHPGYTPKLKPAACTSVDQCIGLEISGSDYIDVKGLDIASSYGPPVWFNDNSDNVTFEGNHVHDSPCVENTNCAALRITNGFNANLVARNDFHDVFEPGPMSAPDDINDMLLFVFDGGGSVFEYNNLWMTADIDDPNSHGGCAREKHGYAVGNIFRGNLFVRCNRGGVTVSSKNTLIEKNRFIKNYTAMFGIADLPYYPENWIFQDNVVDAGTKGHYIILPFQPRTNSTVTAPAITVRRNVFVNGTTTLAGDRFAIMFDQYGPDADFTQFGNPNQLRFSENCYYNTFYNWATSAKFITLWGSGGALGAVKSFNTFVSDGFDLLSFVVNPNATPSNDYLAAHANCVTKGRWTSTVGGPTPTPTPTATPTATSTATATPTATPTPTPTATPEVTPGAAGLPYLSLGR